jgi:hypothetical protein
MEISSADSKPVEVAAPASWRRRGWRLAKILAVSVFVVWHLFFLFYRNIADLWGEEIGKKAVVEKAAWDKKWKADNESTLSSSYAALQFWNVCLDVSEEKKLSIATRRYSAFMGQEQGWCMFAAPLARHAYFPAVRIYFDDDSEELVKSENEFDPNCYARFGGWRQRKLEDTIASGDPQGEEAALWSNYTLWVYRRWRAGHPDDPREVRWLQLLRRRIDFPGPGGPRERGEPESSEIALYTPDGRWVR